MKISTKGRYALRMMVDLAEHQDDSYISLKDIAARQDISKKYLEQIVPLLNRDDFLLTNRGFQGGYKLARKPSDYTIGEILRLTEGSLAPTSCVEQGQHQCPMAGECSTYSMWKGLDEVIQKYLDGITLQDILDSGNNSFASDYCM